MNTYKDALSRLLAESVWIESDANLNSKNEWRGDKITRLSVTGGGARNDQEKVNLEDVMAKIQKLRDRVDLERKERNIGDSKEEPGVKNVPSFTSLFLPIINICIINVYYR